MKKILKSLIHQRRITIFAVLMLMALGIMSYNNLPKQQNPSIELGKALITVTYPGASAQDVERLVTREIEEVLMALDDYEEVQSHSSPNMAVIFYTIKSTKDYEKSWDEARRALLSLQDNLPTGCQTIKLDTNFMKTAGFILSLHGKDYSNERLESYAEHIETSLLQVEGVNRIELEGIRETEVLVELDYKKMNELDLSYTEVVSLIQAQNIEIPAGKLKDGDENIAFKVSGYYASFDDIENTVIAVSKTSGIMTRLKDIAKITYRVADNPRTLFYDEDAVLIAGYFESDQNIIPIGQELDQHLAILENELPDDLFLDKILFQPETVRDEISNFLQSLLQGIVLVIIVVFVGLGIRNALVVAVAIPLSIFVTISTMGGLDVEIQQISIVALIIALGMLVDNAIVVSDAIQVRIDRGQDREKACIEGVFDVSGPVLTSTITTICTFMPILLLEGEIGDYLRSLPIIVIVSLVASYVVAVFVTPVLAFIFFRKTLKEQKNYFDLTSILNYAMNRKKRTLLLVLSLFICSIYSVRIIGLKFFPYADTDMIYVNVKTEQMIDLDHTEVLMKEISDILSEQMIVKKVVSSVGDGLPRFFDTMVPTYPAEDYGQFIIIVDKNKIGKGKSYENLTAVRDAIQTLLNQNIIAGKLEVMLLEQGEPVGAPVNIKIANSELKGLEEAGNYVERLLKTIPGTTNVSNDFASQKLTYVMNVDRYKSSQRGISNYNIQKAINILLSGQHAGVLKMGDVDHDIRIKGDFEQLTDLSNVKIKSLTGKKYFLKDLGIITLDGEETIINKIDGQFIVNVDAYVRNGYSAVDIQNELSQKVEKDKFPNLNFEYKGESDSIGRNFGDVAVTGTIFVALVFGILLIQFKSFLRPLIILVTIPLSITGALFGLLISGISLSFSAFLGIISLAGIVVNNAIVLIDCIDLGIQNGLPLADACIMASKQRTRPILLSTITTVMGLVPLVLMGNDLFTPMAVALMSGLMVSTLLTLIIVPVLVSILTLNKKIVSDPVYVQ